MNIISKFIVRLISKYGGLHIRTFHASKTFHDIADDDPEYLKRVTNEMLYAIAQELHREGYLLVEQKVESSHLGMTITTKINVCK